MLRTTNSLVLIGICYAFLQCTGADHTGRMRELEEKVKALEALVGSRKQSVSQDSEEDKNEPADESTPNIQEVKDKMEGELKALSKKCKDKFVQTNESFKKLKAFRSEGKKFMKKTEKETKRFDNLLKNQAVAITELQEKVEALESQSSQPEGQSPHSKKRARNNQ